MSAVPHIEVLTHSPKSVAPLFSGIKACEIVCLLLGQWAQLIHPSVTPGNLGKGMGLPIAANRGQFAIVLSPQLLQANAANPWCQCLWSQWQSKKVCVQPPFVLSVSHAQPPNYCLCRSLCSEHLLHPAKPLPLQHPKETPLPSRSHSVIFREPAEATLGCHLR